MRILIESGATKSEWRILGGGERFFLSGTNVSSMPLPAVCKLLEEGVRQCRSLSAEPVEGLYLYTAGVVTPDIRGELSAFLQGLVPGAELDIQNDLMGAARGAFGRESGIVAILGTGSNTCFYDGASVSQKVFSGGFILGDDGSASVLGRLFLADWIKYRVPADLAAEFTARFDGSYAGIVEKVYRSDAPARYLGSLAPFILEHYDTSEYVRGLVDGHFRAFVEKSLRAYDLETWPVGVVGGFGWACRSIVQRIFTEYGIRIHAFVPAPIDGLERYHAP
ncbi:MAG: hypothetical protein IJV01_06940 [Bacteroidales bacterium]|nr:hypothetical protein [Bacteroidales bacterium]